MNVKLAAANGSPIHVEGNAELNFQRGGRTCSMKFLDADVQRPLAAVSAIVDEGNTVVLGAKRAYIENDITKERIPMVRKNGVCWIQQAPATPHGSGLRSLVRTSCGTTRRDGKTHYLQQPPPVAGHVVCVELLGRLPPV